MFFSRKPKPAPAAAPAAPSPQKKQALLAHLDLIEAEMKRVGFWTDPPPDLLADYQAGRKKSYMDAPSFELWLQCVFLANARMWTEQGRLPAHSQVGDIAMRQYDYHSIVVEAQPLLKLLHQFDELIEGRPMRA